MKKLMLAIFLGAILMLPGIASSFDLGLVPYADVRIAQLKIEDETIPIARWGLRFEGKNFMPSNFLPKLEVYLSLEGGKVDSFSSAPTPPDELYERCKYGCTWPDDFFESWKNAKSYIATFIGLQYPLPTWKIW